MPQSIIDAGQAKMEKAVETYKTGLQLIKTGRANPGLLSKVRVSYYGSDMPINQIATISTPEATTLMIKPFDKSILRDIEKAIATSGLGLNPQNDGQVLRIFFPPLTEAVRKDLVKEVKKQLEEAKVNIRNIRREVNEDLKDLEKESLISEDELKNRQEDCQKMTDKFIGKLEEVAKEKEKSILEF